MAVPTPLLSTPPGFLGYSLGAFLFSFPFRQIFHEAEIILTFDFYAALASGDGTKHSTSESLSVLIAQPRFRWTTMS